MPSSGGVVMTLKLSGDEIAQIIATLDEREQSLGGSNRRRKPRYRLNAAPAYADFSRQGSVTTYLVYPRNISTQGLGLLHGVYVHNGTHCRVTLPDRTGEVRQLKGTVRHCRHISARIHEVGVELDTPIDPALFSQEAGTGGAPPMDRIADRLSHVARLARGGAAPADLLCLLDQTAAELLELAHGGADRAAD